MQNRIAKGICKTLQLHQKVKPVNHGIEGGEEVQVKGIALMQRN
jgi:hypothetical protein